MTKVINPVQRLRGRAGVAQRDRRPRRTNYLCEHCLKEGRTTLATIVNHIKPLAHGGSDGDENTENLCREHDLKATAEQFGYREPRKQIGVDGWPLPTG